MLSKPKKLKLKEEIKKRKKARLLREKKKAPNRFKKLKQANT